MFRFAKLVALCLVISLPQSVAYAQSDSCTTIQRQIRSFERDREFRNYRENYENLKVAQKEVKTWESQFVRRGCQKVLNAGGRLDSTCRSIGRKIQRERQTFESLQARAQEGARIAQAREQALQQYARFGCSSNSQSTSNREPERKSLFERIFGSSDDNVVEQEEEEYGFRGYYGETYRTVCARTCDGYYWPISFSTISDYIGDDNGVCQGSLAQGDVKLYYYSNQGGSPEDMVDLNGVPYAQSPNAFRYRREFDASCRPQPMSNFGKIELSESGDSSQAVIRFGETSFPLPRRDPRQRLEIEVATANFVPLPRSDPRRKNDGGNLTVTAANTYPGLRLVNFGDKTVRIVGPDTPYVPVAEAGS